MNRGLCFLSLLGMFVIGLTFTNSVYSQPPNSGASDGHTSGDENTHEGVENYWTLKTDDNGKPIANSEGLPQWVRADPPKDEPSPPKVQVVVAAQEAVVNVSCRTTPTNTSGRKTCNDYEVHQLPPDYVFAENEKRTVWHSDIGSSNFVNVSFEDYVEVIPGSGYKLPRRMKVHGHARSGNGYGERGHTNATVYCRFFKY